MNRMAVSRLEAKTLCSDNHYKLTGRLDAVEDRLNGVEDRLSHIEDRFDLFQAQVFMAIAESEARFTKALTETETPLLAAISKLATP